MNISITQVIKKIMGWCPNAEMLNRREEEYMVSYEGRYIDRIKGMGFSGVLGILHILFAVWLISTALLVLAKVQIFPWYVMDINFISSGILLVIGISSLMIFFNFLKSANIQRILAVLNVVLIIVFFLYLSQSLISYEPKISVFDKPFNHYTFGTVSLMLFTIVDVSRFFTTDSEEAAKEIAEKYGAKYVYLSRQRWHVYFTVMLLTAHPDINLQSYSNIQSSEAFDKEFYEPSMAYKFNSGAELKYFDKIFENEDVIIYQLK